MKFRQFRLLAAAAAKSDDAGGGGKPDDKALLDDKGAFSGNADPGNKKDDKKVDPPAKVKVQIGNDTIETDAVSAAALNNLMQLNSQMADAIRNGYKPINEPKPAEKKGYDFATGLFTEPEVALAKLRAEMKAEIMGEVQNAYTAVETEKSFWTAFYKDNSDLADEKLMVKAVLDRDFAKLKNLSTEEAGKKLAESVKKELMRLKGGKSDSDDSRPLEGGSNKGPSGKPNSKDENVVLSLSDIVKNRQAARRKAQFSKE